MLSIDDNKNDLMNRYELKMQTEYKYPLTYSWVDFQHLTIYIQSKSYIEQLERKDTILNLVMGGFLKVSIGNLGFKFLAKHEENLTIYTSSVGSLRGLFYSMYGENFFGRLKDFINKKNNPIKDIISSFELYNNLYAQTTALIRLGRGKMSLYEPQILKEFLKDYFGKDTLKSLNKDINFEVFELKSKKVVNLDKNTSIVDMLMMELAFPPYYPYYLYEDGYFIPSSFCLLFHKNSQATL